MRAFRVVENMDRSRSAAVTFRSCAGTGSESETLPSRRGMQIVTLLDAGKVDDTDAAGGIDSNKPAPGWVKVTKGGAPVRPLGLNDGCMPGRPSCAYPDPGGHGSIPVLGNSPGSTADNVPGNIFTTDGNAEHFPPPQKWRGSTQTMTASSRRPKATSTRRRTDSPTTRGCSSRRRASTASP